MLRECGQLRQRYNLNLSFSLPSLLVVEVCNPVYYQLYVTTQYSFQRSVFLLALLKYFKLSNRNAYAPSIGVQNDV